MSATSLDAHQLQFAMKVSSSRQLSQAAAQLTSASVIQASASWLLEHQLVFTLTKNFDWCQASLLVHAAHLSTHMSVSAILTDVPDQILCASHTRLSSLFLLLKENAAQLMNALAITLSAQWPRTWLFAKLESHSEILRSMLAAQPYSASATSALPQRNVQREQSLTSHTTAVDASNELALLSQCAASTKRSTSAVRHGLKISVLLAHAWKSLREHTVLSATRHSAQLAQKATFWCQSKASAAASVSRIAASTTTRPTLLARHGLHLTISVLLAAASEMF